MEDLLGVWSRAVLEAPFSMQTTCIPAFVPTSRCVLRVGCMQCVTASSLCFHDTANYAWQSGRCLFHQFDSAILQKPESLKSRDTCKTPLKALHCRHVAPLHMLEISAYLRRGLAPCR